MSDPKSATLTATMSSAETTPIIPGFHPDPTICRVGDDYYLAHSSFEYFPGAPIFHSRDLVTWTQIGNILNRRSQFRHEVRGPSTGVYGSTLRHHGGRFWFVTTNVSDFESGQVVVHAEHPEGPWSEPVFVPEAIGIDPDLCWDDDGRCYLTWHLLDFTVGGQGIRQAPIDLSTGTFLEPSYPVWQGSGLPMAEGPHLHHIGRWWYLLLAEGGTERGHCVTIARAPSPRGPFESCPSNPIFTRRSTGHAVQNVGHADLVQAPDGSWAAVYLGVRPRGSTPGFHVLGRETFLAGVDWVDEWPLWGAERFVVPQRANDFTDSFDKSSLHPRWVVPDGEPDSLLRPDNAPGLRFLRSASPSDVLCARVLDLAWNAEATVEHSGSLGVRLDDRHWCRIEYGDGVVWARVTIGGVTHDLAHHETSTSRLVLRIESTVPSTPPLPFGHAGPDDLVLSVVDGETIAELARIDGRYLSTEVGGGFTGRMLTLGSPSPHGLIRAVSYRSAAEDGFGAFVPTENFVERS